MKIELIKRGNNHVDIYVDNERNYVIRGDDGKYFVRGEEDKTFETVPECINKILIELAEGFLNGKDWWKSYKV